jgi:hypothetical protein
VSNEELQRIVGQIRYKDWKFVVEGVDYLQAVFTAADNGWPERTYEAHTRKWRLSRHMNKSEVVQTCLMAVLAAEEHEARERFLWCGKAVFGPHFDIDRLHALCESPDALEYRR